MRPRVCIVAMYLYPLFRPECRSPYGGSEVRASIFARGLAARGSMDIHAVVYDHGQPQGEIIDGVTFHHRSGERCRLTVDPAPRAEPGKERPGGRVRVAARKTIRAVRRAKQRVERALTRPRERDLTAGNIGEYPISKASLEIYERVGADLYLVPGNTLLAAEVALYCELNARRFVLLGGSDIDYDPEFVERPADAGAMGTRGYVQLGTIQRADAHIVQNERQAELLQRHYGRRATIVKNPVELECTFPRAEDFVLWVGKSDHIKQPEVMLRVAAALPAQRFAMILSFSNFEIDQRVTEAIAKLGNVELVRYVPFAEVESYFARARVFVNTSRFEGFPNTFLQAAKYAVPIVSLAVDPGGMLGVHQAGVCAGGEEARLIEEVRQLLEDPARRAVVGARARAYVEAHHDKDRAVAAIEARLLELVETR